MREQPDDPHLTRVVGELGAEVREVDLGLPPRRGLEAALEGRRRRRPHVAQEARDGRVVAGEAEVADLPPQPPAGQLREGRDPLAQVGREAVDQQRPRRARAVDRRLQAAGDVLAHRLAVEAGAPGDVGNGHALAVQFQDHHEFPKSNHRRPSPA